MKFLPAIAMKAYLSVRSALSPLNDHPPIATAKKEKKKKQINQSKYKIFVRIGETTDGKVIFVNDVDHTEQVELGIEFFALKRSTPEIPISHSLFHLL